MSNSICTCSHPRGVFPDIEVPVVAGKENPVIKALWEQIPAPGKENKSGSKINPVDLLPADRSFLPVSRITYNSDLQ